MKNLPKVSLLPDAKEIKKAADETAKLIAPGVESTIAAFGKSGEDSGKAFEENFAKSAVGQGSSLFSESPIALYTEDIKPGIESMIKDMEKQGQIAGKKFANGVTKGFKGGYTAIKNPFKKLPTFAKNAGVQSVNNYMEALSKLDAEAIQKVLGPDLMNKIKLDFEAKAGIIVDNIALSPDSTFKMDGGKIELSDMTAVADNLKIISSRLVTAMPAVPGTEAENTEIQRLISASEKQTADTLAEEIAAAVVEGFKSLGSIGYEGDITLSINGDTVLEAIPKVKLTKIVMETPVKGKVIASVL